MSRRTCPEHPHADVDEDAMLALPTCLGTAGSEPHPIPRWDVRDPEGQVIGWGTAEDAALLQGAAEERAVRPERKKRGPKRREATI